MVDMNTFDWGPKSALRANKLYGEPYCARKIVFIEDMNMVYHAIKHGGYHNTPEMVRETKIPKEDTLPDQRGLLLSFHTHYELFKLVHYAVQTMIEFGIPSEHVNYVKIKNFSAFHGGLKRKGFECEGKFSYTLYIRNGLKDDEQSLPLPFPLSFYRQLFYICVG